jgi:hypothetical protein
MSEAISPTNRIALPWARHGGSRALRSFLGDVLGAFGDQGILIPIVVGLIALKGFSPQALLLWVGLAYLVTGAWARVPMSVQPFKAACILFLCSTYSSDVLFATSLVLGALFLVLGVTGKIRTLQWIFPAWVIAGIQTGLGLILIGNGILLTFFGNPLPTMPVPAEFSRSEFHVGFPSLGGFIQALWFLVPAQFALSLGNSVFASADTARSYFGSRASHVTERRLCVSLGLWNMAAGLLGQMPLCHGSTGITAHVKMGARTWKSNAVIGISFLAASFWTTLQVGILQIPFWILGLSLMYVGVQHVLLIRRRTMSVGELLGVLVMGLLCVWTGHVLAGILFGAGWMIVSRLRGYGVGRCAECVGGKTAAAMAQSGMEL